LWQASGLSTLQALFGVLLSLHAVKISLAPDFTAVILGGVAQATCCKGPPVCNAVMSTALRNAMEGAKTAHNT
jgi:hypothetical protein